MIERLIDFSIRRRWLVLVAVLAVAALGLWNYDRLPIDAVPDITNVQVQINTVRPVIRRSKLSSASLFQSRQRWRAFPRLEYTRSLSRYGLSQVTVIFKDGTDIYFARQLISERITQIKDELPRGHDHPDGTDPHRARRNLYVDSRSEAGCEERTGRLTRTDLRRFRNGSSNRKCATFRA